MLTGACLGRAGFNRKTAYATLAAVLAAEAADLDILWGLRGPVDELKHHRGITHTFWAVPVVAGVVVGAVWLLDRWRERGKRRDMAPDTATAEKATADPSARSPWRPALRMTGAAGVRWGWLYLTACVAALSHILLDWTNNYGVRPFFPLNAHWYAGSFMFIVEPILYGIFFLAFIIPWLLGLADREIGARRTQFRGQGWAIFALAGMLILGCVRWAEHAQALVMLGNTNVASEPANRTAAEPYPVNPFRWHAILETPDFYQTAEINTWTGSIDSDPQRDVLYKPADTPARRSRQANSVGPGLSRLGNMGRGPRRGPGTRARHGPSATRCLVAPGRPSSSPISDSTTRPSVYAAFRRLVRALAAHRLGLHRRRPGRRRRSHEWPRRTVESLFPCKTFFTSWNALG